MLIRTFNFIIAKWFSHSVCWVPFHFISFWESLNRIESAILLPLSSLFFTIECCGSVVSIDSCAVYLLLHGMIAKEWGRIEVEALAYVIDANCTTNIYKCDWFDITTKSNWIDLILFSLELAGFPLFWFHPFSSHFLFSLFSASLPSTLLFRIFMHFAILHGCSINIEWNLIEIRWLFCHKQDRKNATLGIVTAVRMATEIYKYIAWFCYGGSSSQKKLNQNKSNVVRNNEFGS